jgi:hypothetical protein
LDNVKKEYKIELTVVIDDANRQSLIDVARRCSPPGGAIRVDDDEVEQPIAPEELVETVDDALMELLYGHPAFEEAGAEVREMSCTTEESAKEFNERSGDAELDRAPVDESAERIALDEGDDELDRCDSGVYLCRWPNGDFSVVTGDSKRDVIIALDEWAGAHPSQVHPIDRFMADFCLGDEGEIELTQFGEETREAVWDTCYPALRDLLASEAVTDMAGEFKPGGKERVRQAVEHERTRLWENQPVDEPATERGRQIAKHMGTSAVVADHYVELAAKRILESDDGEDGKPN